jgi:hypothetical protein
MWVASLRARERPVAVMAPPDRAVLHSVLGWATVVLVTTAITYITDYNWPTRTGNLCVFLFVIANTYVPANRLRRRFKFRGVQVYYTWMVRWHCYLNTAAFVMACVHCYTTSWTNNWLWLSLFVMGVLTIGGFLLKFQYPPKVRKGLYVLHTQQLAFLLLLYALLKGHYVFLWLPG